MFQAGEIEPHVLVFAVAKVAGELTTVEHYVLIGEADTSGLGDVPVHRYEDLLAAAPETYDAALLLHCRSPARSP